MHHRTRFTLPACLVLGASCTWGIPFEGTGSASTSGTTTDGATSTGESPTTDASGSSGGGSTSGASDGETATGSTSSDGSSSGGSSSGGSTTGGPVCDEPAGEPGSTIRVVRMHGADDQSVHDVALDAMGNVYVFGAFRTELQVDGMTMPEWTSDVMAPFLAKFACDGSLEWVRTGVQDAEGMDPAGGAGAVAVAGSQDVLVTGGFKKALHLGAFDLPGAGESSAFLARYTPEGEVAEAVVVKAPAIVGRDVAEDGQDVYVVGKCQLEPGGVSGVLLSKHDPVTLEQVSSNCITAGVDVKTMDNPPGLFQTTARSLALQDDGLVVAGTYVGMLGAPSTCGPSNDTADAFVAKYTLNLQAEQWCTRFGGNGPYESIDDIVMSGTMSVAVGYSRDGRGSLIDAAGCPDTQGIPPYPAQEEGSLVATLSSSDGSCSEATFYKGESNRIYGAGAAEGSVYVTGQFVGTLQNLDNTTRTFFVGQGADLVWARQTYSSGTVLATGHRVAVGDRLAVIGSLYKTGDANYYGVDLTSQDGKEDSFLLLLWP